jgi:hypothetical protein
MRLNCRYRVDRSNDPIRRDTDSLVATSLSERF